MSRPGGQRVSRAEGALVSRAEGALVSRAGGALVSRAGGALTGRRNVVLLVVAVAVGVLPLAFSLSDNPRFSGSDDQASAAIEQIRPDYKPWFPSVWEPPSAEIESLLFALQAGLGAGVFGYYFGLRRGQAERRREEEAVAAVPPHAPR